MRIAHALLAAIAAGLLGCSTDVITPPPGSTSSSSGSGGGSSSDSSVSSTGSGTHPCLGIDPTSDPANCGSCGHDCQGGACTEGQCQPVELASFPDAPYAQTLSLDATYVYWAADWDTLESSIIRKVPKKGGPSATVVADTLQADILAVDATHVYWSANYGTFPLMRTPLAGGPAKVSVTQPDSVWNLHVLGNDLYWMTVSPSAILTAPITGGTSKKLADIPPTRSKFTVDATGIYWIHDGGTVMREPLSGGMPEVIATATAYPGDDTWIAVDDTHVYWTVMTAGLVMKASLATGEVTEISSGYGRPTGIAVDATHVYWAGLGGVRRAALDGGAPELLASDDDSFEVAVDEACVYWTTFTGSVMKLVK